jgi:formylglycine-generating enzyme required for sulfatase activity
MKKSWENKGWKWFKDNQPKSGFLLPRYWDTTEFGKTRPSAPVVGISWYEANAYCKWLTKHWPDMPEAKSLSTFLPAGGSFVVRLPTRVEWEQAAGGAEPKERFPWDKVGKAEMPKADNDKAIADVSAFANVHKSVGRTTPVWTYPQGASRPYGLMDLGGNVWEWQANYSDNDPDVFQLSGGSWSYEWYHARVSGWSRNFPFDRNGSSGFRLVVLPSFVS